MGHENTLPIVDHIGIIVDDLDRALALFEKLYRLRAVKRKDMPEVGLRVAQLDAANVSIELLQYTDKEGGFARQAMGPAPGINHFSVRVEDIRETIEHFAQSGARVQDGFPRPGSHGLVAFFEKQTTEQVLMEVCEERE